MATSDLTITLSAARTPNEAFNAINSVREWWTEEIEGSSQTLNDEFTVPFFDDIQFSTQKFVEVILDRKWYGLFRKASSIF